MIEIRDHSLFYPSITFLFFLFLLKLLLRLTLHIWQEYHPFFIAFKYQYFNSSYTLHQNVRLVLKNDCYTAILKNLFFLTLMETRYSLGFTSPCLLCWIQCYRRLQINLDIMYFVRRNTCQICTQHNKVEADTLTILNIPGPTKQSVLNEYFHQKAIGRKVLVGI